MAIIGKRLLVWVAAIAAGIAAPLAVHVWAQQQAPGRGGPTPPPPTLGLENGTLDFDTPDFTLKLVKDSQTIAALAAEGRQGHGREHAVRLHAGRSADGAAGRSLQPSRRHPPAGEAGRAGRTARGSISRRATRASRSTRASPASSRAPAGIYADVSGAAADLDADDAAQIAGAGRRSRVRGCVDASGRLVLHFDIKNTSQAPVEIGGLGFPVVFNNMIQNFVTNRARTLPQAHEICSFFDPYVGRDGGYLQVTRLSGAGPALVVVPADRARRRRSRRFVR